MPSVTLARLSLEDGNEIVFELEPEGDEVSVSESAPLELETAVPLLWKEGLADRWLSIWSSPPRTGRHQRTTNGKYRESRGFAVSCRASVRTRHGRKIGAWYYETFDMNASSYWHYTRVWNNSLEYRRQVRMDRYLPTSTSTSESYIRSWIGFKS